MRGHPVPSRSPARGRPAASRSHVRGRPAISMAGDDSETAAAAAKEAAARRLAEERAAEERAEAARRAEEARLRADALEKYEANHEAVWAQATAVVNVKAMIPIILDKATGTYTKWRGMFLTVLGKYALTPHVLDDEALPDRPVWVQVDCVVLSWIFGTVSSDLQQSLMIRQRRAREAWCYLEDEFLGQKESRALLLETQFRNLRQDSMPVTDYCRKLETMAASLAEFGDPIGDRQMVLTLLRGLNGKFRHMVSILKMHRPFPSFADARTHLLLEEIDIDARPPSPPPALIANTPPAPAAPRQGAAAPSAPARPPSHQQGAQPGGQQGGQRGRRRGRGGRGQGPGHQHQQQTPPQPGLGGAPPGFAHPWAGTLQMWPYGRQPPPPPAFTTSAPQYGAPFSGTPSGGLGPYGGGPSGMFYGADVGYPYGYGGSMPSTPTFQGTPYHSAPWNPTHGGAWNQESLVQNFNTMALNPPAQAEWYADSGAGSHMSADAGILSTTSPPNLSTPSSIIVGNGALLPVTAIGSRTFSFPHRNLVLNNVLVSPHIIKNLISIRRFTTDNNCSIEFDPFGLSVKDLQTTNVIARCNSSGDLYPFFSPATSATALLAAPTSLWHRRLGHLGREALSRLISSSAISCHKDDTHHLCHACQLGRHTRLPFSISTSRATNNFDLIHCDLWTSPIVSVSGYKYYLVILDDCSHYIWTFPLRLKSDTFSTIANFFAHVRTQFGTPIKSVQCDNGREFDNSMARTFFLSHGVALRMSCPYTSQQNGKAERSIRTINDILRSLLFQASLPPVYWVEALHTATYLVNRLPTKTLASSSTPFFHLYSTQPSYEHLKVFGCACYPNMSSTAPHKLAPRSSLCVFLGYSSEHKGYRCLELESNRIITSRHVVFDESFFPFADMSTTPMASSALDFLIDDDELTTPLPGAKFVHAGTPAATSPRAGPSSPAPQMPATGPLAQQARGSPVAGPQLPGPPAGSPTGPLAPSPSPAGATAPVRHVQVAASSAAATGRTLATRPVSVTPVDNAHSMRTRGKAGIAQPVDRLNLHAVPVSPLPRSVRDALSDPNWRSAMQAEFDALIANDTWSLVPRPPGVNVVTGKWIFRHKLHADGSLDRYKARWVLRGFTQRPGLDYDETFSPVVKPATVRVILSLALSQDWPIHQLDVKNAFLHGTLAETVYCVQPTGFVDSSGPGLVCRLNKSLYGLKQAPRAWHHRFASYLSSIGFVETKSDSSLFIYRRGSDTAYLLLYVDDIVLTASSAQFLRQVIAALQREFAMTDMGQLHHFLGISVTRSAKGMFLSQRQYTLDILERAGMSACKPCSTPVDLHSKLSEDGPPVGDATQYRSLAGALQYLTFTRPDIAFAVQQICLYMHDPREPHLSALKRILRYLQGTTTLGLTMCRSSPTELVVYTDADWAGCPDTRRSTSGYAVFLRDNLVSWSSKRQHTVSRSSAEAEYRAVANGVAEATWLRQLLLELQRPPRRATLVYCDNVSAVYLSSNPVQHQRTKHVEIDLHFVREKVALGHVRVTHVPTTSQCADVFTKGLPTSLFQEFRSSLTVSDAPD